MCKPELMARSRGLKSLASLGLMFEDSESERRFVRPLRVQALLTLCLLVAAHICFQLAMALGEDDDDDEEEPEDGMPALEQPIGLFLVIVLLAVDIKCKPRRRLWLTDVLVVCVLCTMTVRSQQLQQGRLHRYSGQFIAPWLEQQNLTYQLGVALNDGLDGGHVIASSMFDVHTRSSIEATVAILLAALIIAAGTVRVLYFPLYLLAHCVRAALQQPHLFIGSYGFHLFRFLEIVFPFTCWVARALHERASRRALKQAERVAEQQLELREMKLIDDGVRRENAALAKLSADKEVLLGQISHEMKTPLNGLVGMLTVAQMRLGSAQQATEIAGLVDVETSLEKAQLCGKVRPPLPSPRLPSPRLNSPLLLASDAGRRDRRHTRLHPPRHQPVQPLHLSVRD